MNHKNMAQRLALAGAFMAIVASATAQSLDYSSGTNAIIALAGTATTGANILLPIVVGILLFCLGVGIYKRLTRKAGVST